MPKDTMVNFSITPDQQQFVRENFDKMGRTDIARKLGISKGRLDGNLRLMRGELNFRKMTRKPKEQISDEYFNINEFAKFYSF
jgi:hypothetical protein